MSVDTGFDGRGIITMEMAVPGTKYPDADRTAGFYRQLIERIGAVPGVETAAAINAFPLTASDPGGGFYFEGDPNPKHSVRSAGYRVVTPDYFTTMRISLLKGRLLNESDRPGNDPMMTIVGVIASIRSNSLVRSPAPEAYVSYLQRTKRTQGIMTVAVRPVQVGAAEPLMPTLRATVAALDADVPVKFSTMEERVGQSVADRRFMMAMLSAFAAIALLLAAVGIYSVLSHSVARRTSEIGIRRALGADARSVVGMVLTTAMRSVGVGIVVGAVVGVLVVRVLETFLFGVKPVDPLAFAAAAAVLIAVGLLAAYLPARRATRVDPLLALRAQ